MDVDSTKTNTYLYKLNEMTNGDPSAQVSMYEVGEALGIESDESAQVAEALLVGGQAELKTLSGGIGITAIGMETLGITPVSATGAEARALGNEIVLSDQDRENVEAVLAEIKLGPVSDKTGYEDLETLVMDIKTIEVQMLSPAPKTAVVRETLNSVLLTLSKTQFQDIFDRISAMVKKG